MFMLNVKSMERKSFKKGLLVVKFLVVASQVVKVSKQ